MAVKTGRDGQAAPRLHCAESFSRSTLPAVWDAGIAWSETQQWTKSITAPGSLSRRRAGKARVRTDRTGSTPLSTVAATDLAEAE